MAQSRGRALVTALSCASVVAVASACRDPTEIVVEVSTDVPCPQPLSVAATVGPPGAIEGRSPSATADACDPATKRIGSLVIVPSGAKDADVAIRVVLGLDVPAEQCTMDAGYRGCIVARRELHFISGATVDLPIVMRADCKNVACDADKTCLHGACVPSHIDPSACPGGSCGDGQLADAGSAPADGGRDGAPGVDAGSDASSADAADATVADVITMDAKAPLGATCSATNDCAQGTCQATAAGGMECCTASCGACTACGPGGAQCAPLAQGASEARCVGQTAPVICNTSTNVCVCNGAGGCRLPPGFMGCTDNTQCSSSFCNGGICS